MLKLTYTGPRAKVLHLSEVADGRKSGQTLCNTFGWVDPRFNDGPATLQARFVPLCKKCERKQAAA